MTTSIRDRVRARRQQMKETFADTQDPGESDVDPTPRRDATYDTWAAVMEETNVGMEASGRVENMEQSQQEEEDDESKEAEKLTQTLKKRRKKTEKELSEVLKEKDEGEASTGFLSARERTRQRVLETARKKKEAAATQSQASLLGDSYDSVDALNLGSLQDDGTLSPMSTARSPRKMGFEDAALAMTPRRTSTTLSLTMKQRLKEKMRAAKDKGKDVAYDESRVQSSRKLAGLRSVSRSTRFDDPSLVKKEELEVEETLERSIAMRAKWKKTSEKAKQPFMPTQEEQFDFFMGNWDPELETPKEEEESKDAAAAGEEDDAQPSTSAEAAEGAAAEAREMKDEDEEDQPKDKRRRKKGGKKEEKPEDEKPLLEDLVEDDDDSWLYYVVGRSEYKPYHKKVEEEDKSYFFPSMIAAPVNEKIFEQQEPRFLEDEGFYVGTKPHAPVRNINRMENRLLQQEDKGKDWFGEDGCLIALPDPLKETPSRPPILEELDPALESEYHGAVMSQMDSRIINKGIDGTGQYQLDVDINTVTFSHHHLFSREHVLASRLNQLFQQYVYRSRKKAAQYLTEKLKALKAASLHVRENILALGQDNNVEGIEAQELRLQEYKDEIRQTRQQRDAELGADRTLMKNIINTWKEIKDLRQLQTCNNTSVKLVIKKEPSNKAEDEREWEAEINGELEEIREDQLEAHERHLQEYQLKLEAWKRQRQLYKEAQKRQKKRDKKSVRGRPEDNEDLDLAQRDHDMLAEGDPVKPEKPRLLNDIEARRTIEEKFHNIRRKPGEPRLIPEMHNSAPITANNNCPRGELQRRNEVNRYKIFVKVLFNNKEVSRTPNKPLGQDFLIRFAQIFNVQIMQWPESIKIQIFETTGLGSTMLSELYAGIPDPNVTSDSVQLDELEFSSDLRMAHSHEGVGSAEPFSFEADGSNKLILLTSGILNASVCWAIDDIGNVLVPPTGGRASQLYHAMKGMDAIAAIGATGMADMDKLTKWIAESRLDPNDPSNAQLMALLRPVGAGGDMRMPEHFRLEQLQEEFNFASDEDLDSSRRFRLLQYRERDIAQFKNYKNVAPFDKEISEEVFAEYEKKKRDEEKVKRLDEMESHRAAVAKFMQRVREQVMIRFRIASHQKTFEDVIFEDAVPNIGTIIPSLMKLVEPRRPLQVRRKERKKVTAQNLQNQTVKILINIVRAFDIPVRVEAIERPAAHPPGQPGPTTHRQAHVKNIAGETLVRPFVEVMFQRNIEASSVADGPNPSWNEELQMTFKPPNDDYSASNLQSVKDMLYFNLFDHYTIDMVQNEQERGTSIHQRIEKRWLGSIKVPFSTVYFNARIDGTFRVNKPPVLLGYTHDTRAANAGVDIGIGAMDQTYLTMFITIEPPLVPAESIKEKFDSNEDEKLLQVADSWQAELEKKFPKREYKTTVVDINGKSVFLTRYFKGLKPPEELLNNQESPQATAEAVARFVSMIPFVSDSVVFPGMCDIWSTCDQFLQMLQGDEEEHAVLLANFLLHLGKKTWLLLGSAIPEGPTAYVMTKEDSDYWIWNSSTGEHYSYRDNYCPVQSVGCLIDADNIWANIQPHDQPCRMTFDLNNTSCWKPFFHKGFLHPGLTSVQPEHLIFTPTDPAYVMDIQDNIERMLKERIMEWRPKNITRWNRYCMQTFRSLLSRLEKSRGKNLQSQHTSELEHILGSYKLCGFPINLPYTEMDPIIDAVYATGVHKNETNDIEFALVVHIYPYPNSVLSVWIYVASLMRKR